MAGFDPDADIRGFGFALDEVAPTVAGRRCRRAPFSRNRNRFKHLDTLAAALAKRLRVKDAILDGESICADETGRPIFIEMLHGRHPACFVAFDLLWLQGEDLRPLPLVERKARLRRLLRRRANHLITEALAARCSWPRSKSTTSKASSPSARAILTGAV